MNSRAKGKSMDRKMEKNRNSMRLLEEDRSDFTRFDSSGALDAIDEGHETLDEETSLDLSIGEVGPELDQVRLYLR